MLHCSVHHSITVLDLAAWHVQKTTLKSTRRVMLEGHKEVLKPSCHLELKCEDICRTTITLLACMVAEYTVYSLYN